MAVYVIADLHLSVDGKKSMEVFGHRWQNYMEKLKTNWCHLVKDEDTVIIPGDISWAMTLDAAKEDLLFLNSLPGQKVLCKGNHDFWWGGMQKNLEFVEKEGLHTLRFLYHSAMKIENLIVCGTRGWCTEDGDDLTEAQTEKIIAREAIRLEMSLKEGIQLKEQFPGCELVAFFHFPPVWAGKECAPICNLLRTYGVTRTYHGHIHGAYHFPAAASADGFTATQTAADFLSFTPLHVPQEG